MLHPNYPTSYEIDQWCESLLNRAESTRFTATDDPSAEANQPGVRHAKGARYVRFESDDHAPFWCYWQPVASGGPAPLLVHLPGYGTEMSAHPQLVYDGFNVLHVNPLGYQTPKGPDSSKIADGNWPVLPETISSFGERGYVDWFRDALVAVRWATKQPAVQPNRVGTFGTSQGGGGAILLASFLRDRGAKAIAADEPFLTHFPMNDGPNGGAYTLSHNAIEKVQASHPNRLPDAWRALGFIDTMSHAHRLTMPTLLTAGKLDCTTPPESIHALFDVLPQTRSLTDLAGESHGYTGPFIYLASAWFRLYV